MHLDAFLMNWTIIGMKIKLVRPPAHIRAISFSHSISKMAVFVFLKRPALMCKGAVLWCNKASATPTHGNTKPFHIYFCLSSDTCRKMRQWLNREVWLELRRERF